MTALSTPTRPTGLTATEAARRLAAHGPNIVAAPQRRHLGIRVLHQLTDPLVALLLAAALVTAALHDYADTAVIALVVVVNTVIGVVQEVRADRAIAALDRLILPTARVERDSADVVIPAAELVPGDLIRVETGDVVPADVKLCDAYRLQVDESALTGESVPVPREPGEELQAGTVAVVGRGTGVVVRTGPHSALGRVTALVLGTRPTPTPLQRRLARLGRILGAAAIALSALVFAFGVMSGQGVGAMAITAVSLIVAAVPESLPAVVTLALALGAGRMAHAAAIPRRLHAVETLGSVTVIASDKTGTLTEGRMSVQAATTPDGTRHSVKGSGYTPHGEVTPPAAGEALRQLALAGLLCNDARIVAPDSEYTQWRPVGDPLEAALVAFAARCGLDPDAERARRPRVDEHPFEQATRRMTTVHQDGKRWLVVCKGAPEAVLNAGILDERAETVARLRQEAADLAAAGLRVLALAAGEVNTMPDPAATAGLRAVGVVGVGDPLRDSARTTAEAFDSAGVRLIVITGDHPATAAAIGARLGLIDDGGNVINGDLEAPREHHEHGRVFARIQPEQKLDIIAALQSRGHVVAMTGDGVNDSPALRRADIGVAMGGGTEVARQAADLVLVDDNLATVARAIGEGRRVYDNIRRFLRYALSGGVAELMVMLVGPFVGLPIPLLPAQILWINLLTHGVPGVALGAEPGDPDVLRRPPRSPRESVLGGGLLRDVLVGGAAIAAVALSAGILAHRLDRPWQSVIFVVLGLSQLGFALAVRARRQPHGPRNPALLLAVTASAVLQVAGVLVPPLRALLGTQPLTGSELLACAVAALLPGLGLALTRTLAAACTATRARAQTGSNL